MNEWLIMGSSSRRCISQPDKCINFSLGGFYFNFFFAMLCLLNRALGTAVEMCIFYFTACLIFLIECMMSIRVPAIKHSYIHWKVHGGKLPDERKRGMWTSNWLIIICTRNFLRMIFNGYILACDDTKTPAFCPKTVLESLHALVNSDFIIDR